MKILIYCNAFLPKIDGLVFRIKSFIDYVYENRKDIDIILVTPNPNTNDIYKKYKIYKIKSITLPQNFNDVKRNDIYISDIYNYDIIYYEILKIIDEYKPDIIHIYQGDSCTGIINYIAKSKDIPVIYSWHTDVVHYNQMYLKKNNCNYLFKIINDYFFKKILVITDINNCDKILTVSSDSVRRLKNYNLIYKEIDLIPIIIDTKMFYPMNIKDLPEQREENLEEQLEEDNKSLKILFVGRIDPEKSIEEMISYLEDIDTFNWELKLIGDGIIKQKLENKLIKNKNIKFLGKIPRNELVKYYNQVDLFINPSKTESLGFTTLEALACNTTVLAFNEGGTKDIIKDTHNGFLYNNKDEFHEKLNLIINDKKLVSEVNKNGLKYCQDKNIPNQSEFLINQYSELINNKKYIELNYFNKIIFLLYLILFSILKIIGKLKS